MGSSKTLKRLPDQSSLETLNTYDNNILDLEYEPVSEQLYISFSSSSASGSIATVNLDGTGLHEIINLSNSLSGGIALLHGRQEIVWTEKSSGRIMIASWDGTNQRVLLENLGDVRDIDYNPIAEKIYWVNFAGAILSANVDGSDVTHVITSGLDAPFGISADPLTGTIYWAEATSGFPLNGKGTINRIDPDGNNRETIVTGLNQPVGIDVDPVHGHIYIANNLGNQILRTNLDGSALTVLATPGLVQSVVIDTPPIPEPNTGLVLAAIAGSLLCRRVTGQG